MRRPSSALAFAALLSSALSVEAGPIERARALAKGDRTAEAERLLERRLAQVPDDGPTWVALGEIERMRCRLSTAEADYRRALGLDLFDAGARAGLGEVLLLEGRAEEALAQADLGIVGAAAPDREDARPWRIKALALVELRRYDLAIAAADRAVSIDPTNPRCLEALGAAYFRANRMDLAREWYERAVALEPRAEEANLRLGNGFGRAAAERPWRGGDDEKEFAAALAAWDRADFEAAERAFLRLAARRPEAYKYRLGLGLVRVSIRRAQEGALGGDARRLYALLEAPEMDGLAKVVRGYASLTDEERRVVRVATAPARPFWPSLLAAHARHDVIGLAEDVTDGPARADLRGKRTHDGRRYDHLRGVGGVDGATGAEKLREAAEFAFNTFAHEFGHQVHRSGLSREQQGQVDALYAAAVRANRCLDYYAATNVEEYFAQGYEAFVSPVKRGCLTETARHTRAELAETDRGLYDFLWRVLDTSYERPEVFAMLRAASEGAAPAAEPAGGR